jgi:hypothetical protein
MALVSSHRCTRLPRLGAGLESHALAHPRFRLDVTRHENVVFDDRLLPSGVEAAGREDRPTLVAVLEGRLRLERAGMVRWLGPGDFAMLPDRHGLLRRFEGSRFVGVSLEWDPGTLGPPVAWAGAAGRLSETSRMRLRRAADAIADPSLDSDGAPARFASVLAALRDEGLPLSDLPPECVAEPLPSHDRVLSEALDRSLSELSMRPMLVDLERATGLSSRQILRLVAAFHERYGFEARGWRAALGRRRLLVGVALMTAPGAKTKVVAATMGYGSSTAFGRALANSNLPAPTAVWRSAAALV